MTSNFEKQTLEKLNIILGLLEDTVNNKNGFEVRLNDVKAKKVHITQEREKYLEVGIETSIIGLKDVIKIVEERKKRKEQITLCITTIDKK